MRKMRAVLVAVATLSLIFAACGSDNSDDDRNVLTPKAANLPDKIKQAGVLVIGSDIEYAPNEFYREDDPETPVGMDIDLGNAIAKELGLKAKFVNDTDFAGIIGAMNSGRFDIIMSSMSDTKERQQSADFVDYFTAGSSILVQKGNPKGIKTLDDVCGQTVAVQKGTIQDTEILAPQETKCAGLNKPLKVLRFEKDTDALQQVKLGRAVANFEDFPVAAYNAKTSGDGKDFEVVGQQIGSGPYGIAVPKNSPLLQIIQTALNKLISNGTYDRILKKWNLTDGALKSARINGGA
jgi:polar amino acid transport system substrate-binding protein